MSGEEKVYTKGEMELLLATNEVKTMQKMMLESFNDHMKDDEDHFDRLYEADKEISGKIDNLPAKITECSEKLKTEILTVSRREFTGKTEFQVFRTKIMTGIIVGISIGSILATVISLSLTTIKITSGSP